MSVVHLIEAGSPRTCATTLALLATAQDAVDPAADDAALLLGGPELVEAAELAALRRVQALPLPWGRALAGLPTLARALRGRRIDRLVCWSVASLAAAALLRPATPRTLVLIHPLGYEALRWLHRLLRRPANRARTRLVILEDALDPAMVASLEARGVEAHALPMAIDLGRFEPASREEARRRWRLPGEDSRVVAVLADPPRAADAPRAVLVAGLAAETLATAGRLWPVTLLVHPSARGRRRAETLLASLHNHQVVIRLDPELACPWRVLPGCDVAMAVAPAGPSLSCAWARALGRTVIDAAAERSPARPAYDLHAALVGAGESPAVAAASSSTPVARRWAEAIGLGAVGGSVRPATRSSSNAR